jgi:hypothetical protein
MAPAYLDPFVTICPMKELPIACSLDAGELARRQEELRALGRRALLSVRGRGELPVVLSFRGGAEIRTELERVVAAEAECCAFLDLQISGDDPLELRIDAPADAAPVADELVEAFASG